MSNWIKVSEREPAISDWQYTATTFIAWCKSDPHRKAFPCIRTEEGYFDLEQVDRDGDYRQVMHPVTHWQPMPEGPGPDAI